MSENTKAIIILCSHICANNEIKPFEQSEWSKLSVLLEQKNIKPSQLLNLDNELSKLLGFDKDMIIRIKKLVQRSSSITFEINKYSNMGIKITTVAEPNYPSVIKEKLGYDAPPLLYYCGNLEILNKDLIGFVGSRSIDESDEQNVKVIVEKAVKNGYGIVSGGAKGVDELSTKIALENGGYAVEFLADSMLKKIRNREVMNNIRNNKLLIFSIAKPDAGFNVGMAMMRNKYIYISSKGTVVIKSDLKKGGTWAGATENIRKKYSPICCIENNIAGNQELIKLGAKGIDTKWNLEFDRIEEKRVLMKQLSLF